MQRVLIPMSTGVALRNVLRTDLHDEIVGRGLEPVYLVPPALVAPLAEESGEGSFVDELPEYNHGKLETVLGDLVFSIVQQNHRIATMELKRKLARRKFKRIPMKERFYPVLGRSWPAYHFLRKARNRLFPGGVMRPLLDRWRPAVVFSNNIFDSHEAAVIRRAQLDGTPTVGMVSSWDNPTNKGHLPAWPDRLLVWSEVMREEMAGLLRYPAERISVVGTPQFDIYARPLAATREETLAVYGFSPADRVVVYATGAPVHCETEYEFPRALADLVASGRIEGLKLLVRLHPRDRLERYEALAGRPGVVVASPGRRSSHYPDSWSPTVEDHAHYAALMRYADVVVNIASTVALDAAASDTPIVHVRYDHRPDLDFLDSVERMFHYTHTARLMACGASHVARSEDELGDSVVRAIENPGELRRERCALARQEGFDGRGESASLIAGCLADGAHRAGI